MNEKKMPTSRIKLNPFHADQEQSTHIQSYHFRCGVIIIYATDSHEKKNSHKKITPTPPPPTAADCRQNEPHITITSQLSRSRNKMNNSQFFFSHLRALEISRVKKKTFFLITIFLTLNLIYQPI